MAIQVDAPPVSQYEPAKQIPADRSSLVTIFIPTVGRIKLIPESVRSAQAQRYGPIEILIGDNASLDGTDQYIRDLMKDDGRVSCFRFGDRVSMARNWQEGISRAAGEFVIILSDDDLITEDCVSSCMDMFAAHPDIEVAAGMQETIGREHSVAQESWRREYLSRSRGAGRLEINIDTFNGWRPLMGASVLRTEWARSIGFGSYAGMSADIDMFFRAALRGYRAFMMDRVIMRYRVHPSMNSASSVALHRDALRVVESLADLSPNLYARPGWREMRDTVINGLVSALLEDGKVDEARVTLKANRVNMAPRMRAQLEAKILANSSSAGRFVWRMLRNTRSAAHRLTVSPKH